MQLKKIFLILRKHIINILLINIIIFYLIIIFFSITLFVSNISRIIFYFPYNIYLFIFYLFIITLIFFNIIIFAGRYKHKNFFKRDQIVKSQIILIFILLVICYYKHNIKYRNKPSVQTQYQNKIGPFIQFGPFNDNKLKSAHNSYVIWWFDPVYRDKIQYIKCGKSPVVEEMFTLTENQPSDGYRHQVNLNNLDPDTKYYYFIPGFSETVYSFSTFCSADTFHVLCIGDAGNKGGYKPSFHGYVNSSANKYYSDKKINPAFSLVLGDLVDKGDDLKSWKYYFDCNQIISSKIPIVNVYGNHDSYNDCGSDFRYLFSHPSYYSFDYLNAHFLVIHTFDGFFDTTGRKQYEFIENDLKINKNKKWLIVAMHIPPHSTGDYNMNKLLQIQYRDLFERNKVDLVLSGHDHHFDSFHLNKDSNWGGTFYIVNGGGGSRLDWYLTIRKKKRWKSWYHNRESFYGLYQNDMITQKNHIYGELAWGFLDIIIAKNKLVIEYLQLMDLHTYQVLTEQDKCKMLNPEQAGIDYREFFSLVKVKTFVKRRYFK